MRQQTLKKQIIIISGILVIATILLYISIIFMMRVFISNDMKVHNESMTKIAINQINDSINLPLNLIKNVNFMIKNHDIEGIIVTEYLETIQLSYPYFEEIHLIDKKGNIINTAPYNAMLIGNSVKFEPYFINLDLDDQNYHWSEVYISSNTGNPTISVTFREDDYFIAVNLDLKALPITLSSEDYFEEIYNISILDKWGSYIIADDMKKVYERQRYERFDQLLQNKDSYDVGNMNIAVKKIVSPEWYIIFEFDITNMYRDFEMFSFWALGFWIIILGIIAVILRRYFTNIHKDIHALKVKTHSVIKGDEVEEMVQPLRYIELEGFNQDFNYMLDVIRKREKEINDLNSHLDALVKERTFELEDMNAQLEEEIMEKEYAEEQTRKLNESLDKKVKERTEELEFLNGVLERSVEKAEEANEAKSRFLSIMSHEMRTPLNGIKGFLQLLGKTKLNDEQAEILSVVLNSSDILLELINDILDVEKYASGKMSFVDEPADIDAIIRKVAERFKVLARVKNIPLSVVSEHTENRQVKIDYIKFEQLLNNLLSNAVKFTEEGEINIEFKAVEENERIKLEFAVRDTGIGIREEVKPYLFVPFSQADPEISKNFGGTGLGLAICKEIVKHYDGKIDYSSELGKGSIFYGYIYVEAADSHTLNIKTECVDSKSDPVYNRGKVLVAEDNIVNQELMKKFFEKHKVDFLIAGNGQEAVEICEKENISIILMDCQMPVMDGFEATRTIRSKLMKDISIIAMTAYASKDDKKRCMDAGMDRFISKPIDLDGLEKLLGLKADKKCDSDDTEESSSGTKGSAIEDEIRLLMKRINFDYETTYNLMHTFVDQLKRGIKEIQALLEKQDFEYASKKAHQLKGAAGAVRIERIRSRVENMEAAIKAQDMDAVNQMTQEIMKDPLMIE